MWCTFILLLGHEVVIVKNGHRVCGTGAALANVPILQNKAYFEMKLQQSGTYDSALTDLWLIVHSFWHI